MGLFKYSYIPGYFLQDNLETTWPANPPRFGLLDSSPDRWKTFFAELERLNKEAPIGVKYKFMIFARHGEGWHNVASRKYGREVWDEYWAKLNGDDEIVWGPDAELTPHGEHEARDVGKTWKTELALPNPIPIPSKFYSSPLTRAAMTCQITFEQTVDTSRNWVEVVENCRETYGVHTCDKRRTKSYILGRFKGFFTEPGFSEEDILWDPDVRESFEHMIDRAGTVLDTMFSTEETGNFVSITAHGGIINAFMGCLGRPRTVLLTGSVLPVVIKATALEQN
ncbi:hypothetical protein AX16_006126 [Volvariella volvacea WC 439]|nr:hypothetical protein AX16_006126 [Volvariella volvacea WC 439]